MRTIATILASLALVGCMSTGYSVDPAPPITQVLHQQSSLEGSGVIGSVMVSGIPVTYPVRWSGSGTLTIQYPATPHVIVDGNLAVAPIPPYVEETRASIADGRMRLLRGGQPAALLSPGSIGD